MLMWFNHTLANILIMECLDSSKLIHDGKLEARNARAWKYWCEVQARF